LVELPSGHMMGAMVHGRRLGRIGALLLVPAAGCGIQKPALTDGGPSGGPRDLAPIDVTFFEATAPLSGECPPSLHAPVAFGCTMSSPAAVDALGERRFAIYFPKGRVAGGPVVLAMSLPSRWELSVSAPVVLDADGGAAHLRIGDVDTNVDATLAPGANDLSVRVELFRPVPWDEPSTLVTTTLGLAGDAPEPVLTARHNWLSPVSGVDLTASFMVGDRWRDVAAGRSAGVRGAILIRYGYDEDLSAEPDVLVGSLLEAADWILSQPGTGRNAVKA